MPQLQMYLCFFNVTQTAEDKDKELQEQDKQNRTARVQPTPQAKDSDSPNTPNTDRRKYERTNHVLFM